jgi:hypothetical protein
MAVIDDVRRLAQMDAIYLGFQHAGGLYTMWHKGRLQQANDGNWVFRSISQDGTVVGAQLGMVNEAAWRSYETPATGIVVSIQLFLALPPPSLANALYANVYLQQQLPQELT